MTTYPIGITGLTLTGHLVSGDTVAATFPLTESGTRAGTYYKSGALSATPTAGTYTLELRTDNTAGGLYWQGEVYTDASGAILDSTPQTGDTYAIVNHTTYGNAQLSRTAAHPANWSSLGINASGHVSRVTLVDVNTDMRGTDNAMLAVNYVAPNNAGIADIKAQTDQLTSFDFLTAGTRFLTMIELDGSVYRYTTNAIENGSGLSNEQATQLTTAAGAAAIAGNTYDEVLIVQDQIGYSGIGDQTIKAQEEVPAASPAAVGEILPWGETDTGFMAEGGSIDVVGTVTDQPTQLDVAYINVTLAAILGRVSQFGTVTTFTYVSPVNQKGEILIIQGDDYQEDNPIVLPTIVDYAGPDLSGATAEFAVMAADDYDSKGLAATKLLQVPAVVSVTGDDETADVGVTVHLTSAQTAPLPSSPLAGRYNLVYHVRFTLASGRFYTPFLGAMTVRRRIAT
jgi:hypothetical protein